MADVLDTSGFTGSEQFFRHPLARGFVYTEGVRYVAENAGGGSFWLLDVIFSYQHEAKARREEFQVWTLSVKGGVGKVIMTNGNDKKPIITQDIEATDFPIPGITMWLENKTLYLPSER